MTIIRLHEKDIITMKKNHPCSAKAYDFEVLRIGSDIKIRCTSCLHDVTVARVKLEKNIKLVNGIKPL